MRRRELLQLLATNMMASGAVRAQQKAMPVIGYVSAGSPETDNIPGRLIAFRRGLNEMGHIEGQNLSIECRWADGRYDRLPALGRANEVIE